MDEGEPLNNEIFLIELIIHEAEIENIKQKEAKIQYQMFNMKLQNIGLVNIEDYHSEIEQGVAFFIRLDCFEAFQQAPLYIYFNDPKVKKKCFCACGFDLSTMIVETYKNQGVRHVYQVIIPLEDKASKQVGTAKIEYSITCMSSSADDVVCIDKKPEKVEIIQPIEDFKPKPKPKPKKKKEFPQVNPREADVYLLNIQFRQTRDRLRKELADLERKVRTIEDSNRRKKIRRMNDIQDLTHSQVPSRRTSYDEDPLNQVQEFARQSSKLLPQYQSATSSVARLPQYQPATSSRARLPQYNSPASSTAKLPKYQSPTSSAARLPKVQDNEHGVSYSNGMESSTMLSPGSKVDVESSQIEQPQYDSNHNSLDDLLNSISEELSHTKSTISNEQKVALTKSTDSDLSIRSTESKKSNASTKSKQSIKSSGSKQSFMSTDSKQSIKSNGSKKSTNSKQSIRSDKSKDSIKSDISKDSIKSDISKDSFQSTKSKKSDKSNSTFMSSSFTSNNDKKEEPKPKESAISGISNTTSFLSSDSKTSVQSTKSKSSFKSAHSSKSNQSDSFESHTSISETSTLPSFLKSTLTSTKQTDSFKLSDAEKSATNGDKDGENIDEDGTSSKLDSSIFGTSHSKLTNQNSKISTKSKTSTQDIGNDILSDFDL